MVFGFVIEEIMKVLLNIIELDFKVDFKKYYMSLS